MGKIMSKKIGSETLSRRVLLRSAVSVGAAAIAAPALAQTAIESLIAAPRRGAWDDQFDAKAGSRTVATVTTHNRSEEHTSELQSLMRISYAVFCLKKNT